MSDLKAIQARSLEMAEYFVAFCKEHDLLVIFVVEVLLVPFETRVSFLGMMILISLCRERTTSGSSNYTMNLTLVIMRTPWRIIRIGICPLAA